MRQIKHAIRHFGSCIHATLLFAMVLPIGVAAAASAEDIPTITVPLPPPEVFRDPDWKRDFVGYRAITCGWLSDDGKTFWCIADRGEPVSFLSIREGKAKHDPVFLELDLMTRTIVRELDLPDDIRWVEFSGVGDQRVVYLPATDRLVCWMYAPLEAKSANGDKIGFAQRHGRWQIHSLALNDPAEPVTRTYTTESPLLSGPGWNWTFSQDGRWLWRLMHDPIQVQTRLETLSTQTLETVATIELDRAINIQSAFDFFNRPAWRIDEKAGELWIGEILNEEGAGRPLHWLRFKLADGSLAGRVVLGEGMGSGDSVFLSRDGRYLSAKLAGPPKASPETPRRYWRLPEGTPDTEVRTYEGGLYMSDSMTAGERYVIVAGHISYPPDKRSERIVWRYDRERQSWSWPRKVVVPQGMAHRCYSADGSTFVAFNLIDGRQNRLAVYRFGDEEQYDAELAEALAKQQAQLASAEVEPLPEAEHTIEVSPEGEEVAVDRRVLPVPAGRAGKAAASADGRRVALWMMREDHRPKGREWIRQPIDPATGYFVAVVIEADSGEVVREMAHPPGYTMAELSQYTYVALSNGGRWLLMYYAKDTGREISMEQHILGPVRLQVIDTQSGEVVAERVAPEDDAFYFRLVDGGQRVMLRTLFQGRPTVSTFEFCKLPSLETEAKMRWVWPDGQADDGKEDNSVAQDVRYDPETGRLTALMYEQHGLYNGRHVPVDYWVQYFDARTQKPIGRGPVFHKEHGRGNVQMGDRHIVATYEHPALGNLMQIYALEEDNPTLRINGSAYEYGMHGRITFTEPWVSLSSGLVQNGKPGVMLVHAETGKSLGPMPYSVHRSVLWISPDGRRILLHPDWMDVPRDKRDNIPSLEWLTVRDADE